MQFNLRWLRDYLETDLKYEELLDAITMAGHEVEGETDLGAGNGEFVVGEIVELGRHPDADKLSLCRVRADEPKPLQIVCGATNIAVGQKVPLAKIGSTIPRDGFKLKPTKIRGVESHGMMCSPEELGIESDTDGIWIQDEGLKAGEPFDALIDIKVTPNRPDVLSLAGLARDLAAKTGGKFRLPEVKFTETSEKAESVARVVVEARTDCPRYAARVIRNVKIGPSPTWLRVRLESAGLRSINNVVDVTNYVMYELGHPLHAFDLDTLASHTVVVRNAKPGEKLALLDETEAELEPSDLLIADSEKPIALAGIMGGGETEVSEKTTNILLEAAYFVPSTIRRTARRLGKSTDASYRFERGTDYQRLLNALHRAAQLIADLAGGEVLKGAIDVSTGLPQREPIKLSIEGANRLAGLKLSGRQMSDILANLAFEITSAAENQLVAIPPPHRPDVTCEADLVEEIARIHGYENIPVEIPAVRSAAHSVNPVRNLSEQIIDELSALGFCEAINFSFVGTEDNISAGFEGDGLDVHVQNPLQADQAVMRRSLIPSLLRNVATNLNQSVEAVRLFEIGRTYEWREVEESDNGDPLTAHTNERPWLCVAMTGGEKADWRSQARDFDFFDMKGVAEELVSRLGIRRTVVEQMTDHPLFHPGRSAALLRKGQRLCWFGELHPAFAHELGLKKRVLLLESPLDGPIVEAADTAKYKELPRTPASRRDIAILVDRKTSALQLERTIRSAGGQILENVNLFDLYQGKNIEADKRSLAFKLTFRDPDPGKTLKDEQVSETCNKILSTLQSKHSVTLR